MDNWKLQITVILLSNVLRVFRIAWDVNIEKILYELMSRNVLGQITSRWLWGSLRMKEWGSSPIHLLGSEWWLDKWGVWMKHIDVCILPLYKKINKKLMIINKKIKCHGDISCHCLLFEITISVKFFSFSVLYYHHFWVRKCFLYVLYQS